MDKVCCDSMELYCFERNIVDYEDSIRDYSLELPEEKQRDGTHLQILYCPWCGAKLPEQLGDKMEEVLMEEYGLQLGSSADKGKIPPEFDTDEWWKKRGL